MVGLMREIGIGIDGGKDSLSMAARVGGRTVKAPGALVISAYVTVDDVTVKVTPDLKGPRRDSSSNVVDTIDVTSGVVKGEVMPDLEKPCVDDDVTADTTAELGGVTVMNVVNAYNDIARKPTPEFGRAEGNHETVLLHVDLSSGKWSCVSILI